MTVFVKPIENVLVRLPRTKEIIPESGMLLELDSFIQRRINDGSLKVIEEQKNEKPLEQKKVFVKGGNK